MDKIFLLISLILLLNKNIINGEESYNNNNNNTSIEDVISCDLEDDKEPCIRMPSKPVRGEYVIANEYKINTCIMGKTSSSMQLGIFCYLFDEKTFLSKFKNKKDRGANRHICKDRNRHRQMDDVIKKYSNNNSSEYFNDWKNLLIVREPISRFISGFVQLCVLNIGLPLNHPYCFGCGNNMHCFLSHLYNDIRKVGSGKKKPVYFIKYHFYPQTWQCQYNLYKDKYTVIKYDSIDKKNFYSKYLDELESCNIPKDKIKFIRKNIFTSKISHSTFDKTETKNYVRTLYKSPKLLKLISKIFYDDYLEFDFSLPIIKNLN
uniref:Sulfotransferase domain-containing protein n=1 Tax=Strongyloides stercoralis TaxID=6248 RepID=A0A0K0EBV8_STRER